MHTCGAVHQQHLLVPQLINFSGNVGLCVSLEVVVGRGNAHVALGVDAVVVDPGGESEYEQ